MSWLKYRGVWVGATFGLFVGMSGPAVARELSPAEQAVIADAVRDVLKDPESARFKWNGYSGKSAYCGSVNSKNEMGGYVGFKTFMVDVVVTDGQISAVRNQPMLLEPKNDAALINACSSYID